MNKKISDLTAANGVTAADTMVLNQGGVTKKIAMSTFFGAGIPVPVVLSGTLAFGGTPEQVTSGAISVSTVASTIVLSGTTSLSLAAGVEGQVKILVCGGGIGAATIHNDINTSLFNSAITFTTQGQSAVLYFTNGKWAFLSGTAGVS